MYGLETRILTNKKLSNWVDTVTLDCDDPDTDDEDGPINQQSSTRMLILKAVRKNQQIQKLEEKNPKM